MRVLITGGAGFIGSHLAEFHLANHDEVYVIDDLSTGTQANINLFTIDTNFHYINADLLTFPDIEQIVCWADRIYHMAAVVGVLKVIYDSQRLLETNIMATERLLRAAKLSTRNPRILLASSSEVYGNSPAFPFKEDSTLMVGGARKSCAGYVVSKMALECFGLAYYQHHGLAVTTLRLFNTIGPRQLGGYGMVVPRFVEQAVNQKPIVVYGSGEQTRSFCDVRDVVQLMDKLANNQDCFGEVVNVGVDQEISINQLAEHIKTLAKSSSLIKHIAYEDIYGQGFEDCMFRRPDVSKLQAFTHHEYQWNLTRSLTDLIDSADNT